MLILLGVLQLQIATDFTAHIPGVCVCVWMGNGGERKLGVGSKHKSSRLPGSDHLMIYGEREERVSTLSQVTTVRSFKKCDKDALLSDLDRAPWHVMEMFSSVDEMWDYWKKLFLEIVGEHAPLIKVGMKRESAQWMDEDTHKLMRARNYYRAKHQRTKSKVDWNVFKNLQKRLGSSCAKQRKGTTLLCAKAFQRTQGKYGGS